MHIPEQTAPAEERKKEGVKRVAVIREPANTLIAINFIKKKKSKKYITITVIIFAKPNFIQGKGLGTAPSNRYNNAESATNR